MSDELQVGPGIAPMDVAPDDVLLSDRLRPGPVWPGFLAAAIAFWLGVVGVGFGMVLVVRLGDDPPEAVRASIGEPAETRSEELLIGGTGTGLALMEEAAALFHQETGIAVRVAPSIGSAGGLSALRDGAVDLAWISRPVKPEEKPGLDVVLLAHARVVLAGGRHADPTPLLPDDVVALYMGHREAWPDGAPIVAILREPGDSGTRVFGEAVPGFAAAHQQAYESRVWRVELSDLAMQRALLDCPGSVGLFDLGTIQGLKLPLAVIPVLEREGGPELKPVRPLSLVALSSSTDSRVDRFLEFVTGPDGQALLERWGYLPASASTEGGP